MVWGSKETMEERNRIRPVFLCAHTCALGWVREDFPEKRTFELVWV